MHRPPQLRDPSVARLVAPYDPVTFFDEVWQQRPARLRRSDAFADLMTVDDLDRLCLFAESSLGAVRNVNGKPDIQSLPRTGATPNVYGLYRAWSDGYTIGAKFLHRYWEPVARFCLELESSLSHAVGVNLYFSPPHTQGFGVHHDGHDVFVLQCSGAKHWRVYASDGSQPRHGATHDDVAALGPPVLDCELGCGEGLYIPRGWPHVAMTGGEPSLHLALSIKPTTRADLVGEMLSVLLDADDRWQQALPPAFLDPATAVDDPRSALLEALGASGVLEAAYERLRSKRWAARASLPDGHFRSLCRRGSIDDRSAVRRRTATDCEVRSDLVSATLLLAGSSVTVPARHAAALRFVAAHDRFRVGDLPGFRDPEERQSFVRALLESGALSLNELVLTAESKAPPTICVT